MIAIRFFLLLLLTLSTAAVAEDLCLEDLGCRRFTGVGLGVVRDDDKRPTAIKQVVAMRAAKLEAVRSLAEQIHGIKIATKSDITTSQLIGDRANMETSSVLHGVRFVKVEPIQLGIYQAVAEVDYYWQQ
ncbi:MAG: hypothetical protein RIR18_2433 [Pseudomonadota bacterium]|jgi:hypothetical protein